MTALALAKLGAGEWVTDGTPGRAGKLLARGLSDGSTMFYFRYARAPGQRDTLPLGVFDRAGVTGMSLTAARQRAGELRQRHLNGETDLRAVLLRERRATAAAHQATGIRTLGALLDAYAEQLERDGKSSARAVRNALHAGVRDAWPDLWSRSLDAVDADALLVVVARPVEAGYRRQAEKLRAYLRAAFAAGMRARTAADALPALRELRITANPARDLTPVAGANRARDRALSLAELRAYWYRIGTGTSHALLRFHLLTGAQRIEQLSRVTAADYDTEAATLRLLDTKGRRTEARRHYVPVLPAARDALDAMHGGGFGPWLVTISAGATPASYSAFSARLRAVCADMLLACELPGGKFTVGDLRRTVETRLADAGVSREVRAHLQSHGLSGVQARHYDRADYLPRVRRALETLEGMLLARG